MVRLCGQLTLSESAIVMSIAAEVGGGMSTSPRQTQNNVARLARRYITFVMACCCCLFAVGCWGNRYNACDNMPCLPYNFHIFNAFAPDRF